VLDKLRLVKIMYLWILVLLRLS